MSNIQPINKTITDTGNVYLTDVLLLCTRCRQPIKARINTPNWIRCEWIGPEGQCLRCFQEAKEGSDAGVK